MLHGELLASLGFTAISFLRKKRCRKRGGGKEEKESNKTLKSPREAPECCARQQSFQGHQAPPQSTRTCSDSLFPEWISFCSKKLSLLPAQGRGKGGRSFLTQILISPQLPSASDIPSTKSLWSSFSSEEPPLLLEGSSLALASLSAVRSIQNNLSCFRLRLLPSWVGIPNLNS